MPRVVSLWLPRWPTDRLRRTPGPGAPSPDGALALIGRAGRRRVVLAADAAAQVAGVRIEMPATQAQALVPGLLVLEADPAADAASLERLPLWALRRYAPIASVDPPDGSVIDTTGADHLHGGEERMLGDLVARLETASIAARAAVADSWGAAHAVARWRAAPTQVVAHSGNEAALYPLPVAALRLPSDIVDGLRVLGFERIGALAAQPRAPLALRFGPEVGRRLDQAMGRLAEPITPIRTADLVEVRRSFAEPISAAETIARHIGKLAPELCAALELRGLGVRRLDLILDRVDSERVALAVAFAQPTRDPRHLTRLLCARIDGIDPGFGIERMRSPPPWPSRWSAGRASRISWSRKPPTWPI